MSNQEGDGLGISFKPFKPRIGGGRLARVAVLVLMGGVLGVAYSNCSPVDFAAIEQASKEGDQGSPVEPGPGEPASKIFSYQTTFTPTTQKTLPVDMIWVIDNSGSMENEAGYVRENFKSFILSLEQKTDLRLALISRAGSGGTSVSLPVSGANYLQVDQFVNSHDSLEILSGAICPAGERCGLTLGKGTLSSFLRPESKKIVVVVTDDESSLAAMHFLSSFSENFPVEQLTFSGFVGVKTSSCSIYRVGSTYISLAERTGGKIFDICSERWDTKFVELANEVLDLTQSSIQLPSIHGRIVRILEVSLNGTKLQPTQYSFNGTTLSFDTSLLGNLTTADVALEYEVE